jgi:uncharacterized membrane protein YfcA
LPIEHIEILGYVSIFFGSALSNAGGIGGGGLLLPILLFVFGFSTSEGIPISKIMIFFGAISSFFLNLKQKHPNRKGALIDYNISLIIVPMLLYGTMIGVTLNKILPSWIILIYLSLILIINTYKIFKKANTLSKEEEGNLIRLGEVTPNFEDSKYNYTKNTLFTKVESNKGKYIEFKNSRIENISDSINEPDSVYL